MGAVVAVDSRPGWDGGYGAVYLDYRSASPEFAGAIEANPYLMGWIEVDGNWSFEGQFADADLICHDLIEHGVAESIALFDGVVLDLYPGLFEMGSTLVRVWCGWNDVFANRVRTHQFIRADWDIIVQQPCPEWGELEDRASVVVGFVHDLGTLHDMIAFCRALGDDAEFLLFCGAEDADLIGRQLLGWILTGLEQLEEAHGESGRMACRDAMGAARVRLGRVLFGRNPEALATLGLPSGAPVQALIQFDIARWELGIALAPGTVPESSW